MGGVILGLVGRSGALETDSGPSGLAVAGGHGDEFHEVERDVFVAAGAQGKNGHFHDENSWLKGAVRRISRPSAIIAEPSPSPPRWGYDVGRRSTIVLQSFREGQRSCRITV